MRGVSSSLWFETLVHVVGHLRISPSSSDQVVHSCQFHSYFSRDAERTRKVKEIEHMLSNQQAETNAMNRKKRKLGK